jgi:transposase
MSLRTIRRTLGLNYQTVERYVRSQTCPDWQPGRTRPSCLDPYAEFIRRRWDDGCRCAAQIHRELQEQGCRCGKSIVKEFIRGLKLDREVEQSREAPDVTRDHPAMLSFRQLATAIIRKPVERTERERRQLACLEAGDRELCEAITLGERFGRMVRERRGGDLGAWLRDARASSCVAMRAFARRINQDERAVQAGLDLDWSNGQVEGQVNRLKLVKRMMYGRGGFELLRARLLNAG